MAGSDQWKKTYELNEEAWRKWYREQNRARKNRPLPLLLFVFSTVIQFPLILLYVVRMQMRAGEAAVLLLLSASLGLLACFNRYASKTYAHFRLKQPDPSRQYGTCRIRIQKENVWICKPGKTVEAPAAALKMECGRSGLVAISDADSMLTFIPGDAFCSADERKDMLGAFEEARKTAIDARKMSLQNAFRKPAWQITRLLYRKQCARNGSERHGEDLFGQASGGPRPRCCRRESALRFCCTCSLLSAPVGQFCWCFC